MTKTIFSKYDKQAINDLPQAIFPGRIIVIITESEAEKAVDFLLTSDILGIDSETRPVFKRGSTHQVALLQVSNRDTCFLFRLNLIGFCAPIKRLLEDTKVLKIGLSLHDDIHMLHRRGEFTSGNFIDLQDIVGSIGIKDLSLQKIWANLFTEKISKRERLSNWELPILTDKQKLYAALDAWACIKIYEEIQRLHDTGDYNLVVVPEHDEQHHDGI